LEEREIVLRLFAALPDRCWGDYAFIKDIFS